MIALDLVAGFGGTVSLGHGALMGAVLFVVLKHEISAVTPRRRIVVGLILIAAAAAGGEGVFGAPETLRLRRANPAPKEIAADARDPQPEEGVRRARRDQ